MKKFTSLGRGWGLDLSIRLGELNTLGFFHGGVKLFEQTAQRRITAFEVITIQRI